MGVGEGGTGKGDRGRERRGREMAKRGVREKGEMGINNVTPIYPNVTARGWVLR